MDLERACFPPGQAYSREEYRHSLTRAQAVNLVLEEGQAVIGYVGAFHHRAQGIGHVFTLNVHPKERGRGRGRLLMEACHERLRALGMTRCVLEVNVENAAALRLYERLGYARATLLPDYYAHYRVKDAWLCVKDL